MRRRLAAPQAVAKSRSGRLANPRDFDYAGKVAPNADAKITLGKTTLDRIQLSEITLWQAVASGVMKVDGKREACSDFVGMLDRVPLGLNIVTP